MSKQNRTDKQPSKQTQTTQQNRQSQQKGDSGITRSFQQGQSPWNQTSRLQTPANSSNKPK